MKISDPSPNYYGGGGGNMIISNKNDEYCSFTGSSCNKVKPTQDNTKIFQRAMEFFDFALRILEM